MKKRAVLFFSLFISSTVGWALAQSTIEATTCRPLLWPAKSAILNPSFPLPQSTILELQQWSNKLLDKPSHPIAVLASSGKTYIKDPNLVASRDAFKDADRAAVLALTYQLTHNVDYFNKTKEILINWANFNRPTGNPIDETRLDGMIWAYDLISCDLSNQDKTLILNWFERIHQKKIAWTFGKKTSTNNYRIHQLKMLLLLDKVLNNNTDWENNIKDAENYSLINLNPQTGKSIDYLERTALYYHNYVLQPWLEISLLTDCCHQPVTKAFAFLREKMLSRQISGEFLHSKANIDRLREKGGFTYAQKGGSFDKTRAAPTIVLYYTIVRTHPDPELWFIQQQEKSSPKMVFLKARRTLWQP